MPPPNYSTLSDAQTLSGSGLSSADIAGLTGQSMQINPYMAGIGIASSIPSYVMAYKQQQELDELRKQGITDITPKSFKKYQDLVNQQAASARVAGEGIASDEIARQQQTVQANIERLAATPGQGLKAALGANDQAIQARMNMRMQGMREQGRRRALANEAMLRRSGFEEQSRKEYNAADAALKASIAQNLNKGVQGSLSSLLNSYVMSGNKTGGDGNYQQGVTDSGQEWMVDKKGELHVWR